MTGRPRVLHLHSTFLLGGKEARDVDLMNAFGDRLEHVIVSAVPGATAAARLIGRHVPFRIAEAPLAGAMRPGRLRALGRFIGEGGFDLVLSFNFGALDGVLANRLFAGRPIVHHEDGFNEDEFARRKPARNLYRRLALGGGARLVVPSRTLESIAAAEWAIVPPKLMRIPNGIEMERFQGGPEPDAIPGLERRPGEIIVGTLAGLRPVKNLPRLVRAFAGALRRAPEVAARLVIVGDGPEAAAIRAEAERQGVAGRLLMPGFLPHPHRYVGHFDVFALSSDSEQFPISLVEAMAAGLPAVSTRVGDVPEILSEPNRPLVAAPAEEEALAQALARLIASPALRAEVGAANRARVAASYSRSAMVSRYEALYFGAIEEGRRLRSAQ